MEDITYKQFIEKHPRFTGMFENSAGKYWIEGGKLHREDGPAVEYVDGDKEWYINRKRHREDGPAIEFANGSKFWYINGNLHREDGPAMEYANGRKDWYLDDEEMTEEEHKRRLRTLKLENFFKEE